MSLNIRQLKQSQEDFLKIRCKKCLMPNFIAKWKDSEGNTCEYCNPDEERSIEFPEDMSNDNGDMSVEDLLKLIRSHKKGPYDCMVSITGGRDSSYVLYYAKEVLKLNPLAFNFHTGFVSDIAQENMINVTGTLGVDFIQFRIGGQFLKKLSRGFLINNGEVCSVCHQGHFYTVQKIAQWTGLKVLLRGLCKKTEQNFLVPDYFNWYSMDDDDFNARVNAFAESEKITERELEIHDDFMHMRDWTDKEVMKIDLPDMIDYRQDEITRVLTKLNWKYNNEFIHLDCMFNPILICAQRYAEGYSEKQFIISNLVIDEIGAEAGKKLLHAEENIGFDDLPGLNNFLQTIGVDLQTFEKAIQNNWQVRESSPVKEAQKTSRVLLN
ncbi:MAG: hypothetical protein GY839_14635 [candidate division Zixibacteria bacterium]|nr:hypothetical protein [candidate division Zixibacteria bacterium]